MRWRNLWQHMRAGVWSQARRCRATICRPGRVDRVRLPAPASQEQARRSASLKPDRPCECFMYAASISEPPSPADEFVSYRTCPVQERSEARLGSSSFAAVISRRVALGVKAFQHGASTQDDSSACCSRTARARAGVFPSLSEASDLAIHSNVRRIS